MADEEKNTPDTETAETTGSPAPESSAPSAEESVAPEKPAENAESPAKPDESAPAKEPSEAPAEKEQDGRPAAKKDIFLELDPESAEPPKVVKAKGSKNVHSGIVHVLATFNNTIVTVTDASGNVLGWSSAGKMGFRGSRKSTAYAAQIVSQDACRQAMGHGLKEAEVRVKGPGSGRESAVRAVQAIGIDVSTISDVTPVPHNGCRPPKARRV